MRVDPHLLRTFVTVVRLSSFSAAAAELGYTQAAVSQQIATLESDLRIRLLDRRPVSPTEAGQRLLEHATPILLRLDAARADVMRMAGTPAGRLTAGMSPLAAPAVIAAALAELRQSLPRLDLTVLVASRERVAAQVASGFLDLGIVDGIAAPSDPLPLSEISPLTATGMAEDRLAVVLPASHPLARRDGLRLTDLADARWIDAPGVAAPLADLRRATSADGFRAALRYDGNDLRGLAALAAAGHGLTLLPEAVARNLDGCAAVPVTAPRLVHRVELLHGNLAADSAAAALKAILG
jgi:DNA-binding transcriptional LysR family regulator